MTRGVEALRQRSNSFAQRRPHGEQISAKCAILKQTSLRPDALRVADHSAKRHETGVAAVGMSRAFSYMLLAAVGACLVTAGPAVAQGRPDIVWMGGGPGLYVNSVAFSPDGRMLASGSDNGAVKLWRACDGQLLRTLTGHSNVDSVAFSPDEQTLASGGDFTIRLWRASDGQLLRTLKGHTDGVHSVAFSPDGQTVASGGYDGAIKIWRVSDGELLRTLNATDRVNRVAFSPDGGTLASAGWDRTIKVWRASDGKLVRTLVGHLGIVHSVAFSPDGQMLASGSLDRTIKLWRVSDGQVLRTLTGHSGDVDSAEFSADGQMLASGSGDGTIKLWRASDGALLLTLVGHESHIYSVVFSPDGQMLASGSRDCAVKLWRASDGALLHTLVGHKGHVYSVAFPTEGQTLASAGLDDTIKLWRVSDGQLLRTLTGHTDTVYCVAFSPDGQMLASAGRDDTLRLWRVSDGQLVRKIAGHRADVYSVAFSPDGHTLVSGGLYETVKLWDVSDGLLVRTLTGHGASVHSVAFSPDGQTVASGGADDTVKLSRVSDGQVVRTLAGHAGLVSSVAFSPDGQTLASGSYDWTVKVWRTSDGQLLCTLVGHDDEVGSVAFSPDGQTLASASADGTIRLWRVSDGDCLVIYDQETQVTHSVAFACDGTYMGYGRSDSIVVLALSPSGYRVTPDTGGNGGRATVTVTAFPGSPPFETGMSVKLVARGLPDIVAEYVDVVNGGLLEATFDLADEPVGPRSLVLLPPGAAEPIVAPEAFTVEAAVAPHILVSVLGPRQVRLGREAKYRITLTNTGNYDVYRATAWVTVPTRLPGGGSLLTWSGCPADARTVEEWDDVRRVSVQTDLTAAAEMSLCQLSATLPGDPSYLGTCFGLNASANHEAAVRNVLQSHRVIVWQSPPATTEVTGLLESSISGLTRFADSFRAWSTGLGPPIRLIGGSEPQEPDPEGFDHQHGYKTDLSSTDEAGQRVTEYIRTRGWTYLGSDDMYSEMWRDGSGSFFGLQRVDPRWDITWGWNGGRNHCELSGGHGGDRASLTTCTVGAVDPNDIAGPAGFGSERWYAGRFRLPFTVMFENLPTATAPAADVVVTAHLDTAALDMTSVALGPIAFLDRELVPTALNSPPVGWREFKGEVDLRPANNLIVKVSAGLDMVTGELVWRFNSIDPATGLPPEDPMAGFLPPGAGGSCVFSAAAKKDVATGAVTRSKGTIVFDVNPSMDTPEWFNTLDQDAPTSRVSPLAVTQISPDFTVNWSGRDEGSGLRHFTIYVSDNGGPLTAWQADTTITQATFTGQPNHIYAFYSSALDNAGNGEPAHSEPDAVTLVLGDAPNLDSAKKGRDGDPVAFAGTDGNPVVVSAVFADCIYVESADRTTGIRVTNPTNVRFGVGDAVIVTGTLGTTPDLERFVEAAAIFELARPATPVLPLGMAGRSLGGSDFYYSPITGAGQRGTSAWAWIRQEPNPPVHTLVKVPGLNNIGLLVKTWGRAVARGDSSFIVDDGSGYDDGDPASPGVKVSVPPGGPVPEVGAWVTVIGISSCYRDGENIFRLLRVRDGSDIVAAGGR